MSMLEKFSSRKLLVTLLAVAAGVAIDIIHGMSSTMATFLVGIAAAYNAGNVAASHIATRGDSSDDDEEAPAPIAAAPAPAPQDPGLSEAVALSNQGIAKVIEQNTQVLQILKTATGG